TCALPISEPIAAFSAMRSGRGSSAASVHAASMAETASCNVVKGAAMEQIYAADRSASSRYSKVSTRTRPALIAPARHSIHRLGRAGEYPRRTGGGPMSDAMSNAARYRARRDASEELPPESDEQPSMVFNAQNKAEFVETAIQLAIRRGEFDDLPGAGKPIEGLGTHHDPDWWIRRKIERENLSGLGPPALMLRVEDRELDDELDRLGREDDVRTVLEDFNRRVIEARRQLLGGPFVITETRDVDAEIAAWRQ